MDKLKIERILAPRLKIMGMILIVFALIAFAYSFFPEMEEEEDLLLSELAEEPPLINMYIVTAALGLAGAACIVFGLRKQKELNAVEDTDR